MRKQSALAIGAIAAAVMAAYVPVWRAGFVWDDSGHVTRPDLRSLGGLGRIWFKMGATQQYYPLLHSFFWLEHRLWGDHALGYHLANVLLHLAAAVLFAYVLARVRRKGGGGGEPDLVCWLAALLFAVHPLGAESAAWISEEKNTLSAVFYLLAAREFLVFWEGRRPRTYLAATGAFACALLSKTVAATLPGGLLVALWWREGRIEYRRDVRPLLPWFLLAAAAGATTAWVERAYIGAQGAEFALSPLQRLELAGRIPWFYLSKLLWPVHLVFFYPHWTIATGRAGDWMGLAALLAAIAAAWAWRRRSRTPLAVALFFVGTLGPALGFINVYAFRYSYVADHFAYLASLGIFAAAAAALVALGRRLPRALAAAALAALVAVLGALTWRQARTYRDPETFYRAIIARNPSSWMAQTNLGEVLVDERQIPAAIGHYEAALALDPGLAETHYDLGVAFAKEDDWSAAAAQYREALRLHPEFAMAHNNLGIALEELGRTGDAEREYEAALAIQPRFAAARHNLDGIAAREYADGVAAFGARRWEDAARHFENAVGMEPDNPVAQNACGAALACLGRDADALQHYEIAIQLRPRYAEAHYNLGLALKALGQTDAANRELAEAARLRGS